MAKEFDISVLLKVTDKATAPLKNVGKQFQGMAAPVRRLGERLQTLAKRADNVAKKMRDVGKSLMLRVTAPLMLAAGLATKASISFETAFTGVRKTVEATETQFAALKKELMDMALKIPLATQEIFGIGEAAGQLGITAKDIPKFTKVMADLAATTDIGSRDAAMSLARFAKVTKMPIADVDRLGSTISYLGNTMAATESEIVEMGMRLAGAGKLVGLTQPQIMGLGAALVSLGIRAEAGGTAFSQVMRKIDKEIGSGSDEMKGFAWVAGQSIGEFEKLWEKDAAGAIIKFVEGLGRVREEGINVNQVLDALGMEGMRISDSLLRASGAGDSVREAMGKGNKAWKENIALVKEAELRYKTTESQLIMAKTRAIQMAVAYGDILKPMLIKITKLIEPLVDLLGKLGPTTKIVLLALAGIAAMIPPILIGLSFLPFALKGIGITLTFLSASFLPLLIAVAALATSAYLIIKHWKPIRAFFKDFFGWIAEESDKFVTNIQKVIDKILDITPDFFKKAVGLPIEAPPIAKEMAKEMPTEKIEKLIKRLRRSGAGYIERMPDVEILEKELERRRIEKIKKESPYIKELELSKSETDINLKVSLDERLILAGYEKKGRAKVNFIGESYLGNTFGFVPMG